MKLKRLAIALCATVVCCGSVFAQTNTLKATPSVKIKNSSPNLTWSSSFPFYVRNDTYQTLTNIWAEHSTYAGSVKDPYTIPVLKPGQQAGPFIAHWVSNFPDNWNLYATWPGSTHPRYQIQMNYKQCSITASDVENNPSWVVLRIEDVGIAYSRSRTSDGQPSSYWNAMYVTINPPESSSCSSNAVSDEWQWND